MQTCAGLFALARLSIGLSGTANDPIQQGAIRTFKHRRDPGINHFARLAGLLTTPATTWPTARRLTNIAPVKFDRLYRWAAPRNMCCIRHHAENHRHCLATAIGDIAMARHTNQANRPPDVARTTNGLRRSSRPPRCHACRRAWHRIDRASCLQATAESLSSEDGSIVITPVQRGQTVEVQRVECSDAGPKSSVAVLFFHAEEFKAWCESEPMRFKHPLLMSQLVRRVADMFEAHGHQ